MKWPKDVNITGKELDLLARRHLYEVGKDFQHGTGHGVGYFLGVHEGPVGISKINTTVFKPGMIVSNEPGYYEPGKYGIRIENLIMCMEK
jgi:Xaa-Pro aminopeptidase